MAKLLKLRRGTTSQHSSFTGAEGEVTVDTDKEVLVVHDGSTAGGHPMAAQDMDNVPAGSILGTQLENSGVTAGQYGSSSAIPIVTVDAQGLVTAASTTAIDSTTIANGSSSVSVANNGAITSNANHDFSAGIDVTGNVACDGIRMGDGDEIRLGNSDDLKLFHNGNHSIIADVGTGNLQLRAADFRVTNADNSETMIAANTDGAVELYHNNTKQVQTTADGVGFVNNCTFSDNKRAKFGDSNDLQIFHDGHSRITDTGSGALLLETDGGSIQLNKGTSENMIVATVDGKVELFHNGTGKIETQSTGIGVSGNIAVTGTVDGVDVAMLGGLSSSSGVLTNGVTATTQGTSDNSTKVATTAYVTTAIGNIQAFVSGMILIWSGASNAIPSGWVLCNGSNSTPDLRDRFVIGATNSYSVGATGGSTTINGNVTHSHSTPNHSHGMNGHTHSTPNHSHSVNNHTHSISGSVSGNTNNTGGHSHNCSAWRYGSTQGDGTRFMKHDQGYQNYNLSTGNSGNHNHSFSGSFSGNSGNSNPNTTSSGASNTGGANGNTTSSGASNTGNSGSGSTVSVLNPYYALCYIMKT